MVLKTIHNAAHLSLFFPLSFFLFSFPFFILPFHGGIFTLYSLYQSILTFHLLTEQVTTWVLVPSAAFPHLQLVVVTETILFRGLVLINAARTFVGAFNAEVIAFPWTAPTLYPRASPIVLVFSSESTQGAAFDGLSFFPFRFWDAEDKIVLGYISRPLGLSLHVFGNVSPQRGPWALM